MNHTTPPSQGVVLVADPLSVVFVAPRQLPAARPNTTILFTATTRHAIPMPPMSLCPAWWEELLGQYPDPVFRNTLCLIARYGAKVGYEGPDQAIRRPNLASANEAPGVTDGDLKRNRERGKVAVVHSLGPRFVVSPLALVPKPAGGFRRIHHLSTPPRRSVNDHIPSQYGHLKYALFNEALAQVQKAGPGAIMVKRDLADAFRHIPIHPSDWWLFRFKWQGSVFQERFLPFGLWTAPRIFNYFAEGLHWILQSRSTGAIIHYLDDFLAVVSAAGSTRVQEYGQCFQETCDTLGLEVKLSKNAFGTTIEFLGLIIDSRRMEARLPPEKKEKGLLLISELATQKSCTLLALQRVTGLLNFLSKVVPLGRTFCRRLYDLEQRFPTGGGKAVHRRIPSGARKDLKWWRDLLPVHNGVLIIHPSRRRWRLWTDAAGKKGIGGFILPGEGPRLPPYNEVSEFFSARVLFSQRNEHINVKEMIAVLVAFKRWAPLLAGCRLHLFCDNTAVVSSLRRRTSRGRLMAVLRKTLLLAARYDIEIEPQWIPSAENCLADALSRFEADRINQLAPQLRIPRQTLLK